MSLNGNKFLCIFLLAFALTAHAKEKNMIYTCPATFNYDNSVYPLANASVFDDSNNVPADLVPDSADGGVRKWEIDKRMMPVLVCRYKGTAHTIHLRATGSALCEFKEQPAKAYCK